MILGPDASYNSYVLEPILVYRSRAQPPPSPPVLDLGPRAFRSTARCCPLSTQPALGLNGAHDLARQSTALRWLFLHISPIDPRTIRLLSIWLKYDGT